MNFLGNFSPVCLTRLKRLESKQEGREYVWRSTETTGVVGDSFDGF